MLHQRERGQESESKRQTQDSGNRGQRTDCQGNNDTNFWDEGSSEALRDNSAQRDNEETDECEQPLRRRR